MTTVQFDTAFKKITRILKEKGVYTIAISYLRYAHKNYKNLRKEFLKGKKNSINRIIEAHEYEINNDTDDE